MVLQSIGGGGGYAADVAGAQLNLGTVSIADTSAGDVQAISRNWQISTEGRNSPGLTLQSIGGGGGVAFTSKFNSRIQTTGISSPAVIAQSIGGGGLYATSSGGDAISLNSTADITTVGIASPALLGQSIAGAGAYIPLSNTPDFIKLGSNGSGSAQAGDLTISTSGILQTEGIGSQALILQSIGGGGGFVGDVDLDSTDAGAILMGRQGSVSDDLVDIALAWQQAWLNLLPSISTNKNSELSFLDDIDLGLTALITGPGGGGDGGAINLDARGSQFSTQAANSSVVLAQSIGGGGGWLLIDQGSTYSLLGSLLSDGGDGGSITLTIDADLISQGDNSPVLVSQSIGGGGGYAGSSRFITRLGAAQSSVSMTGGAIDADYNGAISSSGNYGIGLVLQSVGGGGGMADNVGGAALLGATDITSSGSFLDGGAITGRSSGSISTRGNNAPGLLAQSIGGGGGRIGNVDGELQLGSDASSVSQSGGAVTITSSSSIATLGENSSGLVAQSVGGGGGIAGINTSLYSSWLGAETPLLSSGGAVSLTSGGAIRTAGNNAAGLVAQSVGGGGGLAALLSDGVAGQNLSLGSRSASGANSGAVTVTNNGDIITSGVASPAVLMQSLAGGGGAVQGLQSANSGLIQLGSSNSSNANAAAINFTSNGGNTIATSGLRSAAAVLQSIGGGGGWSLVNSLTSATLGASDLNSGTGGAVSVILRGQLQTTGNISPGLVVQSIGAGGGFAGDLATDATLGSSGSSGNLGIAGSSGLLYPVACRFGGCPEQPVEQAILIDIQGDLITTGSTSPVMLVQAIGGGGGRLGTVGGDASLGMTNGSGNADGGAIRVISNAGASMTSTGDDSAALVVQSIGGGGGSVNSVAGDLTLGGNGIGSLRAGAISLNGPFTAITQGAESPGVVLQSIGGGGGFASATSGSVQLGAGGSGTLGSDAGAGAITWSNNGGVIGTSGNQSPAVVLQSIGGGGGYTTGGSSANFAAANHGGTTTASGALNVSNSGTIVTSGDNSFGVLLQTIGGGGGVSGSDSGAVSLNNTNADSSSADISFTNTGAISTSGTGAHAVVAQTIAGGGGFVFGGVSKDNSASLLGKPTGGSGDINIDNSGSITASGTNAVALLFQNATGGAYLYQNPDGSVSAITEGFTDGTAPAGEVVVRNSGVIRATGTGGVGITKSTSLSSGNLRVENAAGALIQGGDGGSAINLPTDRVERVINHGTIIGGSDGSSNAITGRGGPDEISNFGEISGDIIIPGITRNIYNAPNARLESQLVDANGNVTLIQRGVVNPNGEYRIGNLVVNANYDTTDTSVYEADLVLRSGETDNLTTRYRANLNGTVNLLANQVGQAMPGTFISEGIVDALDGITIGDLKLVAPKWAVASFGFDLIDNNQDLSFRYTVDYAPSGLDPNSTAVGKAVNKIQAKGSTAKFESTAALIFAQETKGDLNGLYRQLSGATSAAFPQATITAGLAFQQDVSNALNAAVLNQLQRCIAEVQQLKPGETYTGDPADCGKWRSWVNAGGSDASTPGSGSSDQAGYNTTAFNTTVGADTLIGSNTLVGLAGRFDNLWTTTGEPNTFGETEGWSGMVYAKQRLGSATWLSGSFGVGGFNTDITRQVNIPGYPATETGSSSSTALGGTLQLSQVINTGNQGSLIPSLGISWLQLNQNSYSESTSSNNRAYQQPGNPLIASPDPGKASYSLRYDNVSYSSVPLELGVEFKQPFQTNGMTVIPRVSVGYAWDLGNTNRDLTAQFTAAPGSSFTVAGVAAPSSWWNLGLGLDVVVNDKLSLYVNGLGQLAPGSTESINYGGGFRWKF